MTPEEWQAAWVVFKHENRKVGRWMGIPPGRPAFLIAATCILLLSGAYFLLTTAPAGWQSGNSLIWSYSMSLYSIGVTRNEDASKSEQHHEVTKLSQLFDTMEERQDHIWLNVAKWEFCQGGVSKEWCHFVERLLRGSWLMLCMNLFGVACLLMGGMAGFVYHYIEPRYNMQKTAAAYLLVASVTLQFGPLVYLHMTSGFGDLIGEAGSSCSWAFLICCICAPLSWVPTWIMISFAFDTDDGAKLYADDSDDVDYGALYGRLKKYRKREYRGSLAPWGPDAGSRRAKLAAAFMGARRHQDDAETAAANPEDGLSAAGPRETPAELSDLFSVPGAGAPHTTRATAPPVFGGGRPPSP